jgi:acetyl/propionyl-CoA carboxylase alpha subunit
METVAISSSLEEGALHTQVCDFAVILEDDDPRAAYMNIERIVATALQWKCTAIHPGYGFLAENAELARQTEAAGLIFVGPTAETIHLMGGKIEARKSMENAGVPVIPGRHDVSTAKALKKAASEIGFPLLIKASAGGGGKGMRRVSDPSELAASAEAAKREAEKSFGDGTVYLEKFVSPARHIEVQILGDGTGRVVHFGERDCSVQRRYQKIVEIAPAPDLDDDVRARLHQAAVMAGEAVNYRGAGTVEFVLGPDQSFYFLEMNTRLQVEHPITECVFGVDLVTLQLEVAHGMPLNIAQEDVVPRGHAIEARLYAEDPQRGFLPAPGPLLRFVAPSGPGIRVDAGFQSGDVIHSDFDPMIAKIIAWAPTREQAVARIRRALRETVLLGLRNNLEFLKFVMEHKEFQSGSVDTGFVDQNIDEALAERAPSSWAFALAELGARAGGFPSDGPQTSSAADPFSPWAPGRVSTPSVLSPERGRS